MKVLLVDDDTKLSRFLTRVLTEEGYAVDACARGADAVRRAKSSDYNVIILDWMLPDLDGVSVCSALRESGETCPILMLTARGEVRERVLGLESGADDYMVKPFEVEELVARVHALLRRSSGHAELRCGALLIDRVAREVTLDARRIELTAREYALLLHLVYSADKIVTRSELLSQVWETSFDTGSNLVEVHVSRLRDKLEDAAWMIETVRGVGYRLRARRPS